MATCGRRATMCTLIRWTETELTQRRKGDPVKVEIAWRLREETTMTLKWIAQQLQMGNWTHVSNCLVDRTVSVNSYDRPEWHLD